MTANKHVLCEFVLMCDCRINPLCECRTLSYDSHGHSGITQRWQISIKRSSETCLFSFSMCRVNEYYYWALNSYATFATRFSTTFLTWFGRWHCIQLKFAHFLCPLRNWCMFYKMDYFHYVTLNWSECSECFALHFDRCQKLSVLATSWKKFTTVAWRRRRRKQNDKTFNSSQKFMYSTCFDCLGF